MAIPGKVGRLTKAEEAQGYLSQSQLAARYGVTQASVSSIVRRKTWA